MTMDKLHKELVKRFKAALKDYDMPSVEKARVFRGEMQEGYAEMADKEVRWVTRITTPRYEFEADIMSMCPDMAFSVILDMAQKMIAHLVKAKATPISDPELLIRKDGFNWSMFAHVLVANHIQMTHVETKTRKKK